MRLFLLTIIILFFKFSPIMAQRFDIQGHRGARGLMPENTVPGFLKALEYEVTTLEMDVVISKDSQVVVSHDPYLSATICSDAQGKGISRQQARHLNLYQMDYGEIKTYDCGSTPHPRFPNQENRKVSKPLLSEVFKQVEQYIKDHNGEEIDYNIELKSHPEGDGVNHPVPSEFSDIVHDLIGQYIPYERLIIQSFDFRVLRYWHENYPEVRLAALVENQKGIEANLESLGFKPHIYSPYFRLLNKKKIQDLHKLGLKVVPWTINKVGQMKRYHKWGVDGLITDYPNLAHDLLGTGKEKK